MGSSPTLFITFNTHVGGRYITFVVVVGRNEVLMVVCRGVVDADVDSAIFAAGLVTGARTFCGVRYFQELPLGGESSPRKLGCVRSVIAKN